MGWIKFLLGATVVLLCSATMVQSAVADDAKVIEEKQISPRLLELTVETPAFAEPTKLHVFLPTGYPSAPSKRWPVTYVLAGTMNNYDSFAKFLKGEELTGSYPSIIVSPDGNSGYWSDWYNGGTFGQPKYETFVIDQLIPLIDSRYRTRAERGQRAVVGISMGGYGSMMYAARHPDLFGAAATLSGAVDSNQPLLGAALSFSSTFDGGIMDAINGPRATEEVRWRGHNPTDLASNLRDVDLQVLTANGILNPGLGEGQSPDDAASCVVEGAVYQGSISLHERLEELGIGHTWKDYGDGCHTPQNFTRETVDSMARFEQYFADPPASPATFDYRSIEPSFQIWGWQVDADPGRALEFMRVEGSRSAVKLEGSGLTKVATPAWYRGLKKVDVNGTPAKPGADGRLRFNVDLGPANNVQQFTLGSTSSFRSKSVKLAPHAILKITKAKRVKRGVKICIRAVGGNVKAQIKVGKRRASLQVGSKVKCRSLSARRATRKVTVKGRDAFGHRIKVSASVR